MAFNFTHCNQKTMSLWRMESLYREGKAVLLCGQVLLHAPKYIGGEI